MKTFIFCIFIASSTFAQIPSMLQDKAQDVMKACADDKKNIKGCESYTELAPLKICLMKNKDKLSDKCKKSLTEK